MDDNEKFFTLVFAGNLRKFAGNPFKTETPFGIVVAAAIGDKLKKLDEIEDSRIRNHTGERGLANVVDA